MCSVCTDYETRAATSALAGIFGDPRGAVAQLVERVHGMDEVARSIRVGSTISPEGFVLGGFVAGEGSFSVTQRTPPYSDGTLRKRFVFSITVASRDRALLDHLRAFLGEGSICDSPPRKPGWQPTTQLRIASIVAHRRATIPFAETYLLPACAKRQQFERWRDELDSWVRVHPSRYGLGPRPCSVQGCERPVRGRGLCRRHYYRATGY